MNESNHTMRDEGETRKHAKFAPSSMESLERCSGFRNREGTSQSSERGARIHKALEIDDLEGLAKDEKPVAQTCKDFIDGLIAERRPALPDADYREIRLSIDLGSGIKTFGTCDRLLVYGTDGQMLDYKSGYREVADAEDNAQAWCYVIGAFQRFPILQTITFYFLIPNRDEVLHHTFNRTDVPRMKLRINTIVRKAMVDDPKTYNPQGELCEYCRKQATCPALAQLHLSFATKMKPPLQLPSLGTVSADRPDDIPHLLRLAPLMESWAKGIKEEALRLNLEEGVTIKGFTRIERSVPRSTTSVLGTYEAIKDKVSLEDFLAACSTVSVPQLEDMFAEMAEYGKKGSARKELEIRLRSADVMREEGTRFYLREQKK